MWRPRDTSIEAHERQFDLYRSMSPAQRLRLAATMTDEARAITESGIRARHPDWSPKQVAAELMAILRRSGGRDANGRSASPSDR